MNFMKTLRRYTKLFAVILIMMFLGDIVFPIYLYSLTNGPSQPEFSSFESVSTTGMVNEFSGDFNYNLPLMEVPGPHGSSFPFSLSYHSGNTQDEDAGWVGYGWTLNPGSIMRNVRGNPDDDAGVDITKYTYEPQNETFTARFNGTSEVISSKLPASLGGFIRYNTHKGWSVGATLGISFAGYASLNCTIDDGNTNFSGNLHPQKILQSLESNDENKETTTNKTDANKTQEKALSANTDKNPNTEQTVNNSQDNSSSFLMGAATYYAKQVLNASLPSQTMANYSGSNITAQTGGTFSISTIFGPLGGTGYVSGTYSNYSPDKQKNVKSYGYLYSGSMTTVKGDESMDFSKEKYAPYEDRKKILPIPISTPDNFSVSGEGIGGSFRFHHTMLGLYQSERSYGYRINSENGIEATAGGNLEIGFKLNMGYQSSGLKTESSLTGASFSNPRESGHIASKGSLTTVMPHSARNRNKVEARFSNDLGGSVLFDQNGSTRTLENVRNYNEYTSNMLVNSNLINTEGKAKYSSYIDYTTVGDMRVTTKIGDEYISKHKHRFYTRDDKTINIITGNNSPLTSAQKSINFLGDDAIAEFAVHKDDGKTYVYGLPVLSRKEKSASYNVYSDRYPVAGQYREKPYATTYLLTQILSPDYVDVDGNGPSENDLGGWVSFDYRRASVNYFTGPNNQHINPNDIYDANNWYGWRQPYFGYKNDPNLISNDKDDMRSEMQGEKQIYYLESVSTKTHVAYFVTNKTTITKKTSTETGPIILSGSQKVRGDAYEFVGKSSLALNRPINHFVLEPTNQWNFHADIITKQAYTGTGSDPVCVQLYDFNRSTDLNVPNFSQNLEKIVLYKRTDVENVTSEIPIPIKTVNFEFDYEAYGVSELFGSWPVNCTQAFNDGYAKDENFRFWDWEPCYYVSKPYPTNVTAYSVPGGISNSGLYVVDPNYGGYKDNLRRFRRMGKLTLRKVWFEYENVKDAKVSPYEFHYMYSGNQFNDSRLANQYPYVFSVDYWNGTTVATETHSGISSLLQYGSNLYQIPMYNLNSVGAWGNYTEFWTDRQQSKRYYNRINYVTQSPIMDGAGMADGKIVDPASWQLKRIVLPSGGEIRVHYENHDYSFVQNRPAMAMVHLKEYNSSEQTYTLDVEKALGVTTTDEKQRLIQKINALYKNKEKIAFNFTVAFNKTISGDEIYNRPAYNPKVEEIKGYADLDYAYLDGSQNVVIKLRDDNYTPDDLFNEYYRTNMIGKGSGPGSGGVLETITNIVNNDNLNIFNVDIIGKEYYKYFSFFRIPLTRPKKGGYGVRVKRVLMYNPASSQSGEESIYGKEYIYKQTDKDGSVISTGVATNEPDLIRDENPLITMIEAFDKEKFFGFTVGGENIKQVEGPLGESLLPAPSVGYSRVIVRDIHKGKTNTGLTVTDYYTAKDFPFSDGTAYTNVTEGMVPFPIPISIPFPFGVEDYKTIKNQGYRFITNNMHGQIKRVGKYSYNIPENSSFETEILKESNWVQVEYIEYEYFKPGELLPLFTAIDQPFSTGYNGIESEIVLNSTTNRDLYVSASAQADVGISLPLSLTASVGDINGSTSNTVITTNIATKIITYPAVLKKVTAYQNGMTVITENLAFSPQTGEPIVKSVTDEYHGMKVDNVAHNGTIINYSVPAYFHYSQMQQKSINQKLNVNNGLVSLAGNSSTGYSTTNLQTSLITKGDLIEFVRYTSTSAEAVDYGIVRETSPSVIIDMMTTLSTSNSDGYQRATVVRSGRTNQIKENLSEVALYGVSKDIAKTVSLQQIISNINSGTYANAGVISTSGNTFSDNWTQQTITAWAPSEYLYGGKGKWREKDSYAYLSETESAGYVYGKKGLLKGNFQLFDPSSPGSNWKLTSTVTNYSPNGVALQEQDITGKYTSAIYSHGELVPSIIGYDARRDELYYKSFEEDNSNGSTVKSHTGKKSFAITAGNYIVQTANLYVAPSSSSEYLVMLWTTSQTAPQISGGTPGGAMEMVARNGEWVLYKKSVTLADTHLGLNISNFSNGSYLDDIRIQPARSKTTAYVYDDKNLRLMAQFDDQHFALLYQYNAEGKLIRKLKETERGTKTLAETQYNTVSRSRKNGNYNGSRYEIQAPQ